MVNKNRPEVVRLSVFSSTPENEIEWKAYESTHYIPQKDAINESLNWLDKYFGPVNK